MEKERDFTSVTSSNFVSNNSKAKQIDTYLLVNVEEIKSEPESELNAAESESKLDRVETIVPSLHPEARRLIEKYKVTFPDELPKCLPPIREIEHRIDLIDGAQPPQSTIYRMSEHELIELKKQINSLLENGFIKPSISPYGSPCL